MSKVQKIVFMVVMTGLSIGIYYLSHFVILRFGDPESPIYRDVEVWAITPAVMSWILSLVITLSRKVADFFFFTIRCKEDENG